MQINSSQLFLVLRQVQIICIYGHVGNEALGTPSRPP